MKDLKKIADELVEKFKKIKLITLCCNDGGNPCVLECNMIESSAHECAIQSVNHAINCLEAVIQHDKERYGITSRGASIQLDEQLELKKILEQRS
jgi:hypothetical protein